MKKNIIIALIIFLGTTNLLSQDSLLNKFGSLLVPEKANADHVYRAVESGIYVVRSQFALKSNRTGQEFGKAKYKNQYFGYSYAIALSAKNQLWIPPSVLEPWGLDSAYKEYGDTIRPVLKDVFVRVLNDTVIKRLDAGKIKISEKWSFPRTDALDSTKNLAMPHELPTDNCWLLSFYVDENAQFKSVMTSIKPVWDKNKITSINQPLLPPKGKLVGGVLLKEQVSFGKIAVEFVGSYFFDGQNWIVQAPLLDSQLNEQMAPIAPAATETSGKANESRKNQNKKSPKADKPNSKDAPKKVEMPKAINDKAKAKDEKEQEIKNQ